MGFKDEKTLIFWASTEKSDYNPTIKGEGSSRKTDVDGGNFLKKGGEGELGQFANLRGGWYPDANYAKALWT